jgi:hypothetical protein
VSEAEPRRIETPDALCSLSVEAPEEGLPVFFQLQILLPNTNTVNNGDPHLYLQVTAICSTQSFPWRLSSATAAVVAIFGVFALEPPVEPHAQVRIIAAEGIKLARLISDNRLKAARALAKQVMKMGLDDPAGVSEVTTDKDRLR